MGLGLCDCGGGGGSSSNLAAIEAHVEAMEANVEAQEAAVEVMAGQVSEDADTANAGANTAVAAADLADRMANEIPGVEVLPGKYSGNHYLESTRAAAAIAASFRKRVLTLSDFPTGVYTVKNGDLFRTLEVLLTSGTPQIKLPVNLWQVLDEDGNPTEAWIRFRYHKDGTVFPIFVPDAVPVVLNPAVLATAVYPFAAEPAVLSPTHNLTPLAVPAGNNRRICFLLQASYDHPDPAIARNTLLGATGVTGLTKVGADSSSLSYTSNGAISSSLWEATVTGSSAANIAITLQPDGNVLSYVLYVLAASNTASFQATPVNASVLADTQHELTLTPVDDKSITVWLIGHQGDDALPLTAGLAGGTLVASGKTPKARAQKDIAYVAGYGFVTPAAGKTYTSTSAKIAKGAITGVIIRPDTAGMVTAVLTAPGGNTLSAPGRACTICAHSDGINYTKED